MRLAHNTTAKPVANHSDRSSCKQGSRNLTTSDIIVKLLLAPAFGRRTIEIESDEALYL